MKVRWLPFALLGAAIVAALTVFKQPAAVPEPSAPSQPEPPPAASSVRAHPADPPLDPFEERDVHLRLAHELCEEGARRINELNGRDPNDAQGAMRTMSVCLRHGNVAWHKCILRATTREEAATCSHRLLRGENAP